MSMREIIHPERVYHVEHVVMVDGAKHYAFVVWGGKPGKEYALVSVRLDLAHLSEHRDGQITHRYERPIEDPRR